MKEINHEENQLEENQEDEFSAEQMDKWLADEAYIEEHWDEIAKAEEEYWEKWTEEELEKIHNVDPFEGIDI